MQVFRLVDPGRVDRVIAFDSLPEEMLRGIIRGTSNGLSRAWHDYLGVKKGEGTKALPFYVLDFRTINRDKEKWQEITNYVRRSTDKNFRLMDNMYEMAKPMAIDSYSSLDLEPEDVLVVPIIKEEEVLAEVVEQKIIQEEKKQDVVISQTNATIKKRGRPKKELAA